MKRILSIFVIISFVGLASLAAESKKAEDPSVPLMGEYTSGAGYKMYFNKDKSAYLQFSGYARFRTDLTIEENTEPTYNMDRFRWYFDAYSSKKWSLHTRFDYYPSMILGQSTITKNPTTKALSFGDDKYTTPGIYFARAYVTYSPTDNISIDMGRNLIEATRYELVPGPTGDVGHGINIKATHAGFTGIFQLSYKSSELRMYPQDPKANDVLMLGRLNYKLQLAKEFSIDAGVGVLHDTNHHRTKFMNVVPDIYITYNEFYLLDEFFFKKYTDDSIDKSIANHLELGYTITKWLGSDAFHQYQKTLNSESPASNTFGLEFILTWDKNKKIISSSTYEITDSTSTAASTKVKTTSLQLVYYF